jgi:hypothetical protein
MPNAIGSLFVELGINAAEFVEGLDKATYKSRQAAKEMGNAFEGIGDDLSGLLGRFGEFGNVLGEGLAHMGETVAEIAGHLGSVSGVAGAAAIGIASVAAAAGAGASALTAMALSGRELVNHLEIVSAKTGISVEDLHVLDHAGATVGLSLDQMTQSFRRFDEALTGVGRNRVGENILTSLGIAATGNKEALYQLADVFSKMPDGVEKSTIAVELFGRAGLNMIPFLDKGRDGLKQFEELVKEYGPAIGDDAKDANEAFLISQQKVELAWERMTVQAESAVLPTLSTLFTKFADLEKGVSAFAASLSSLPEKVEVTLDVKLGPGKNDDLGSVLKTYGEFIDKVLNLSKIQKFLADQAKQQQDAGLASAAKQFGPLSIPDRDPRSQQAHDQDSKRADVNEKAEAIARRAAEDRERQAETETEAGYKILQIKAQIQAADERSADPNLDVALKARAEAAALYAQLPPLQARAALEKQIIEQKRYPTYATPAKDVVGEELFNLRDSLKVQEAIADAVADTAAQRALDTAAATANKDVDTKEKALADEITRLEGQKANIEKEERDKGVTPDPAHTRTIQDQIDQKKQEMASWEGARHAIEDYNVAKKAVETASGATAKLSDNLEVQTQQLADVDALTKVSGSGAAAERAAKLTEGMKDQQKEVDTATDALDAYAKKTNGVGSEMERLERIVAQAQQKFNAIRAVKVAEDTDARVTKLNQEALALQADAAAWQIRNDAIGKGQAAKIEADSGAARTKALILAGPEADETDIQEANQAGAEAGQKALEAAADKAAELGAQLDLNASYKEEITNLELVKKMYARNADVVLAANAQEYDDLRKANEAWDEQALKVGNFGQIAGATLDKLSLDGQHFWADFSGDIDKTVGSFESGLSRLVFAQTEGFKAMQDAKNALVKDAENLGETTLTNVLKSSVGKGADLLKQIPGIGKYVGGQTKADGTSEATALWVRIVGQQAQVNRLPVSDKYAGLPGLSGGAAASPIVLNIPGLDGAQAPGGTAGTFPGPLGDLFAASKGANTTAPSDFSFLTDANAASNDFNLLAPTPEVSAAASSGVPGSGSGVNIADILKLSSSANTAFSGISGIADAIAAQSSTTGVLGSQIIGQEALGTAPSVFGTIFSKLGSFLGMIPGLADGGDVTPGKAYIVGEDHPELFIPGAQGKIVPTISSGKGGSGPTIINQMHVHGVTDMDSFRMSSQQIMGNFHRMTSAALARNS